MLGINLGKNSCSVASLDEMGRVFLRRMPNRDGVVWLAAKLPASVTAMEAFCGPTSAACCAIKVTRPG